MEVTDAVENFVYVVFVNDRLRDTIPLRSATWTIPPNGALSSNVPTRLKQPDVHVDVVSVPPIMTLTIQKFLKYDRNFCVLFLPYSLILNFLLVKEATEDVKVPVGDKKAEEEKKLSREGRRRLAASVGAPASGSAAARTEQQPDLPRYSS